MEDNYSNKMSLAKFSYIVKKKKRKGVQAKPPLALVSLRPCQGGDFKKTDISQPHPSKFP